LVGVLGVPGAGADDNTVHSCAQFWQLEAFAGLGSFGLHMLFFLGRVVQAPVQPVGFPAATQQLAGEGLTTQAPQLGSLLMMQLFAVMVALGWNIQEP